MVAVDNGDGTQQLAIPVMDPETGQETYMIIDPQTAQVGWELLGHFQPWLLAEHRRREWGAAVHHDARWRGAGGQTMYKLFQNRAL